ncbi:MAG TPA: hypothetical protein VKX41_15240 [Alloacidobacterium sp.]|jgi:hypothetical protein|nr:hypothetical protein [Alloacidobacterium sp.]
MIAEIPDGLRICPGCNELTSGADEYCFSCARYEEFYESRQARGIHAITDVQPRVVVPVSPLCEDDHFGGCIPGLMRMMVVMSALGAFIVFLPMLVRMAFWLERMVGLWP